MRAWLNLRHPDSARADAFRAGLCRLGFQPTDGVMVTPGDGDILITWNRIGIGAAAARAFEAQGRPVVAVENATWGNGFVGSSWLTMARGFHNLAGRFPVGDSARWDDLGVRMSEFRSRGETVILPSRGIGPRETAMPKDWPQRFAGRGRIRPHPGRHPGKPLADDLAHAATVITWGSGAAVQALLWGVRVESHLPGWIAEQDNTEHGRLEMFRRLAWAQWRLSEIASGEAIARLLEWN